MYEPLTITDAAPLIKSGELTPSEMLEQCLKRVDIYEHAVKAWVYLDRERARQEAARFTDEIKKGHYRGPLHGIPIGIKDIIDVFDMPTGCGSKLWANSYARKDATCVSRLRDAGAVIMGKTVTTPYAYLDPPVTLNPWNLARTPGGSSSGSAAAVACAMCLGALGTQTGGSLTRPASYCGVCSLKPTYGRVSVEGVLPLAPSVDHVGVMARCVRDMFSIYRVLVNSYLIDEDEYQLLPGLDNIPSSNDEFARPHDFTSKKLYLTQDNSLKRCNEIVSCQFLRFISDQLSREKTAFEVWKSDFPIGYSQIPADHRTVLSVEAAAVHRERYRRVPNDFPPKISQLIEDGMRCDPVDFSMASNRTRKWELCEDIRRCFFDGVLIGPATTTEPPSADTTGDPVLNVPWSFLGFATASVPIAFTANGFPIAVQIVSPNSHKEMRSLRIASLIESAVDLKQVLPPIPNPV